MRNKSIWISTWAKSINHQSPIINQQSFEAKITIFNSISFCQNEIRSIQVNVTVLKCAMIVSKRAVTNESNIQDTVKIIPIFSWKLQTFLKREKVFHQMKENATESHMLWNISRPKYGPCAISIYVCMFSIKKITRTHWQLIFIWLQWYVSRKIHHCLAVNRSLFLEICHLFFLINKTIGIE